MLKRDQLIRYENGPTLGFCEKCGAETFHVRVGYENPDDYECLTCACAAVPGHMPMHNIFSGMHFRINPGNGIGVLLVHYSADPDKNPDTDKGRVWLKNERKQFHNRPQEWNRRYEIDSMGPAGPRIFPEFDDTLSYKPDLKFVKGQPLLVGFDYGTLHPAATFSQWDTDGNLRVLLEVAGDDPHIEFWFTWINRLLKIHFFADMGIPDAQPDKETIERLQNDNLLRAYGDPAGNQRDSFKVSAIGYAKKYGWRTAYRYGQSPISKIAKVRMLTVPGETGQPKLFLNGRGYWLRGRDPLPCPMEPRCDGSLLAGFMGGYHWRQDAKGRLIDPPEPDKKSNLSSHIMDGLLETVSNTFSIEEGPKLTPLEHSDTHCSDWSGAVSVATTVESASEEMQFFYNPMYGIDEARP